MKVENEKNKKPKVAVIGLGKMGLLHACVLRVLPTVELAALCDKSTLILRIARKLCPDIQITDDLDRLSALDLDAIYITTPIPSHFSLAKHVYSKNIADNLFIEKTLASNYEEGRELCRLCQDHVGVNMVGYMKRFAVTFRKAKDLLDRGTLGNPLSFHAHAYSSDFLDASNTTKISDSRGGVLNDLGSHVIDLAVWFFGDLKVQSARLESRHALGCEDSVSFDVSGNEDLEGRFDISWIKKEYRMPEFGLTIRGKRGTIIVDDDSVRLDRYEGESCNWYRHNLDDNVFFLLGEPEYSREDEFFVNSILNGGKGEPSFEAASKVDQIISQVKKGAVKT